MAEEVVTQAKKSLIMSDLGAPRPLSFVFPDA